MKDPIKFTDIESQGITIFAGIILIAMTIWLNSAFGPLWASIFAMVGISGIVLRAWRRSASAPIENSKTDKEIYSNENIGKEEIAILDALRNITSPDDALPTGDVSEIIGLDIPKTAYFLNRLKSLDIVNGPYIIGEGQHYLLTEQGFQLYYHMNKVTKDNGSKLHLPKWLTGEDVMKYYNLSHDLLMQYVRNGLPVYPSGNDVLILGDEVPPLSEEDLAFEIENEDYSTYRFKKSDIEKFIKKE